MSEQTAVPGPGTVSPAGGAELETELAAADAEELILSPGKSRIWIVRVLSIIGVVGAWEILGRQVDPLFMSYPSEIAVAAVQMIGSGELLVALISSLRTLVVAFLIACVVGVSLGLLIGRYQMVDAATDWLVNALYATPLVAVIPLVILWFGLGNTAKTFIVTILAVFPILINTDHCKQYPIELRWQVLEKGCSLVADSIVAVSEHTRDELIQYQRIAPAKLQVIRNGIDVTFTRPDSPEDIRRELGLAPDDIVIGTAARLEPQKGLDLLIDSVPLLVKVLPKVRVVIVGGGSLEAELRQRADALGLGNRVIITGYRTDAVDVMRTFDCFVQTSIFEGMPMALLEAMALEKPIVASAVGGVPEVVEDGVTGTLLHDRSPEHLARAILDLLVDPAVGRRVGAAGRARYEQHFTARAMVSQYERLYAHYLAQKRAPHH
jgi:glycosyltransferase involved in cell wall biosynthesis